MTTRILLPDLDAQQPAVSTHTLRRALAGELDAAAQAALDAALRSDPALQARLEALRAEDAAADAAFRLEVPLPRFLADHEARAPRDAWTRLRAFLSVGMRLPAMGAAVAGAAALLFVVATPEEPAYDGLKGGARVGFFVKDDGGAHPGSAGEQLGAGDRIQFTVRDDASKSAMVLLGVDGRGQVTVYAAEQVDTRTKGEEKPRLLPVSVVLDDATGPERFFVVYADDDVATLKARVEAAARSLSGADLVSAAQLPLDAGHVQSSVHIVKIDR